MLVKEVIQAIVEAQAVRVVDPAAFRRKMHGRAQRLLRGGEGYGRVAQHRHKALRRIERHGAPRVIAQIRAVFGVRRIGRIGRVKFIDRRAVFGDGEPAGFPVKPHGDFQITFFDEQFHFAFSFPFVLCYPHCSTKRQRCHQADKIFIPSAVGLKRRAEAAASPFDPDAPGERPPRRRTSNS